MMTVYKYPIEIVDEQMIEMPENAHALSVQMQRDKLCIWALVNPERKNKKRRVRIVGTGNDASDVFQYLGTVQMFNGNLVWHVFISP